MQIALTKKLADAIGIKPSSANEDLDPMFSWTANWTNTFQRRKEDMIVMVNNATRFTVLIYGVKGKMFKDIAKKMEAAIRNTLLSLNVNEEVIDEYFKKAGEIVFTANHDRKMTAVINRQGLDAAYVVGRYVNKSGGKIQYNDTFGRTISNNPVNYSKDDSYIPREKMLEMMSSLAGKPVYKYRAFELSVTLDLDVYKAVRRLMVPADIEFTQLHGVLQDVFSWKRCHLYDFAVFNEKKRDPVAHLVASEDIIEFDGRAILMDNHKLSEYFPQNKCIIYTYDMGDNWEHEITLVREINEHNEESPYLLEVSGQTPPEDVGGVTGFVDFREVMMNPEHPDYPETKAWVGYWSPELTEWEMRPRPLRYTFIPR